MSPRNMNDNQSGQFVNQRTITVGFENLAKECRKPKRVKDYAYHKEKMMLCKHEEKCVPLSADQGDWLDDIDEEPNKQELEAHYMYMAKIQEDTYVVEKVDSNVISYSSDMCDNDGKDDQNAEEYKDKRAVLANLVPDLKLDTDENKKIQKQSKKENASLAHELKKCKSALIESNDVRDRCRSALHLKELDESFSPSPIPVEDSDSFMEEIDLSLILDDSMPSGIENDDYDSEGDMLILEELLSNDFLLLSKSESFHFDIPSSSRPLAKPPDDDLRVLTVKVVGDISEQYIPMPRILPTQPTFTLNQEKSPHLLSHQGLKAFQLPSDSPIMIYGGNTPILDVPFKRP
nr:hypothetical protein [Tanacetum cinerariifolium]